MKSKLVSVIIPVYNTPKESFGKCVKSVLKQSYQDFEIIIVDDGSKEEVAKSLDNMFINENKVTIIHKKNSGVSEARNTGLINSNGEYITFIDADDFIEELFLEQAISYIEKYNLDIVVGNTYEVNGESKKNLDSFSYKDIKVIDNTYNILEGLLLNYTIYNGEKIKILQSPWCKMFKKSVIGEIKFPSDVKYGEDGIFNANVFKLAKKVGFAPEYWYNYLINDESAMAINNQEKMLKYINGHVEYISKIVSWGKEIKDEDLSIIAYKKVVNVIIEISDVSIKNYNNKIIKKRIKEILQSKDVEYSIKKIEEYKNTSSLKEYLHTYICKFKLLELLLLKQRLVNLIKKIK